MNATFLYCTSRDNPELHWFLDSLQLQCRPMDLFTVLVIRPECTDGSFEFSRNIIVKTRQMKPCVWAGPHRLTKENWWSKSCALNTGLCLAETDWICTMDDRAVIQPGWLDYLRLSLKERYVLLGAYQKRVGVKIENGIITHSGIVTGDDSRAAYCEQHYEPHPRLKPPYIAPGSWVYGCTIACPLQWALDAGGFNELADSAGGEDYLFGQCLENAGRPIRYEPRMMLVEDRTEGLTGPVAKKTDKGQSPKDKSHAMLDLVKGHTKANHGFDILAERKRVLSGKGWSPAWGPFKDWYDQQPVEEFE